MGLLVLVVGGGYCRVVVGWGWGWGFGLGWGEMEFKFGDRF